MLDEELADPTVYKAPTNHVSLHLWIDRWVPAKLVGRLTAKLVDRLTA